MSSYLMPERPVCFQPSAACILGVNLAIMLQQIHWLESVSHIEHDGHKWVKGSVPIWEKEFPFMSQSTIKRTIADGKRKGVLIGEQFGKHKHDQSFYYRVNHERFSELVSLRKAQNDQSIEQNRPIDSVKMTLSTTTGVTADSPPSSPRGSSSGQIDPIESVNLTPSPYYNSSLEDSFKKSLELKTSLNIKGEPKTEDHRVGSNDFKKIKQEDGDKNLDGNIAETERKPLSERLDDKSINETKNAFKSLTGVSAKRGNNIMNSNSRTHLVNKLTDCGVDIAMAFKVAKHAEEFEINNWLEAARGQPRQSQGAYVCACFKASYMEKVNGFAGMAQHGNEQNRSGFEARSYQEESRN